MNVYKVTYEIQYQTTGKKKRWWDKVEEPLWVLANGDARKAIKKAERHTLNQKSFKWEDDNGKEITEKVVGFRLLKVEQVGSVDVC